MIVEMRPTARDCAAYMLRKRGPMSLVKLQALLYLASLKAFRDTGSPIFAEPFYKDRRGAWVRSVTADWLRRWRKAHERSARRLPALRRRVRTWSIQERARARSNPSRINMPGGWGFADSWAQTAGINDAMRLIEMSER